MTRSPKEADFPLKHESRSCDDKAKASSPSAQWLRLKDPRIVRVSRAFGGKDRHSKVCTIRGLRDRRVRLSVPTAIQLYDLQDRLGLNQPSKVVDWLLNAAKHEIDELPPLPMSPGNFSLCHPSAITSNEVSSSQPNEEGFNINGSIHWEGSSGNAFWKSKSKEVSAGEMVSEKANWTNRSEENKLGSNESRGSQVVPNNLLSRANHSPFLGLLNTTPLGYQWEPSGVFSHSGNPGFTNQTDLQTINVVPLPSSSLSPGTSQLFLCPPGATQYLPSHVTAMDMDPRQIDHYQMLSSGSHNLLTSSLSPSPFPMSQSVKPFSLSMMTPKHLHSPNSRGSQSHKDGDFSTK